MRARTASTGTQCARTRPAGKLAQALLADTGNPGHKRAAQTIYATFSHLPPTLRSRFAGLLMTRVQLWSGTARSQPTTRATCRTERRRQRRGGATRRRARIGVLCTGCLVATRAECLTVRHSRCPAWSDVTDFPTGGPSPGQLWPGHRFLSEGPLARPSLAVTPPTRATPVRSQASRPASARRQAGGGASAAAGASSWAWPRSHPLRPLTKGTGGQEPVAQEIPRCGRHGRRSGQCPGAAWCRLCSSRAEHEGVHGTIAWGTCGARGTAARSDTSTRERLRQGSWAAAAGGRDE